MATLLNGIWDSGQAFVEPQILYTPETLAIAQVLQADFKDKEFSVLFKGSWTPDGFQVTSDHHIPKQEVASASVDYKEDLFKLRTEQGFNTVVHSHPKGMAKSFSQDDKDTINFHFDCSMLFCDGSFTLGHFGLKLRDQLKISVNIAQANINMIMPDILVDSSPISIKPDVVYKYERKNEKNGNNKKNKSTGQCPYGMSADYCGFFGQTCHSCDGTLAY